MARPTTSRLRWWLVCCASVRATFVVLETKPQCFAVEQPHDTEITVRYEIPSLGKVAGDEARATSHKIKLTLADRRNEDVVYSRTIADHQGEVELTTKSDAVHHLCFKTDSEKPVRLDFDINVGLSDRYYDELATKHHMDKLQVEVVKLNDELAVILAEADYMKEKEVKFHAKSERINLAAIWWPMLQLAILIFTALFSVNNLKTFFSSKNLY